MPGEQQKQQLLLNLGIAGCGQIASDFVRAMQFCQTPNKVCAVASSSARQNAVQFCQQNSLPNDVECYGSYAEMFADARVQCVYIANKNHQHYATVLAALEAGKHVLCEKPMGVNAQEVATMVAKARAKGVFLMEAYWTRFFPIWRELIHSRQNGSLPDIGPVQMVQCDFGFPISRVEAAEEKRGGGEGYLMAIGCYCVMAAQMVFADERPVEICAKGGLAENGIDLWASVLLRYANDRLAQIFYSGRHQTAGSFTIFGQNGNIKMPGFFWSPEQMVTQQYFSAPKSTHIPLPAHDASQFAFPHSAGLHYEIDHVNGCIVSGQTESDLMGLDQSVTLASVLEEVRRQLGVKYPQD